jgi:hypothetical protein
MAVFCPLVPIQARGPGRCRLCLSGDGTVPLPDDESRRWWLERFDDDELCEMTRAMFGRASLEYFRRERERLLGRLPVTYLRRGVGRSESGRTSWPHASQRVAP